mmetsp:Transcript_4643/g.7712  ORF Transcript_4643/g.7712 Transcript_4643/m.7712 type:complete len:355 (+) Transcript_4643:83-1147(+)
MTNADRGKNYVLSVVASYWFVSISMVYLNKYLMNGNELSAPLFVTWYQCVVTCAIIYWCSAKGEKVRAAGNKMMEKSGGKPGFFEKFPVIRMDFEVAKQIMPLSVIFVGMITFNNLCLKYVEVSFYNVARSLTICFNVAFTYFMLGRTTSNRTLMTLVIVIWGFFVGTQGEVNFSFVGTFCGIMSSAFVSLNSVFTERVLPVVQRDKWRLSYLNNANACALFLPLILVFESGKLADNAETLLSPSFWVGMTAAGVFGFLIGIVTVMQIEATSPLTHNISGTAKAAVQSILAFYIWGNEATAGACAGIFLVLFGSGLYAYIKMREREEEQAAARYAAAPQAEEDGMGGRKNAAGQ